MASELTSKKPAVENPVPEQSDKSKAPACCEAGATPSFNETTIKALEDARDDRDLTRYADEDDLFQKMGIKVGKTKA
jgi:hypothetical protein